MRNNDPKRQQAKKLQEHLYEAAHLMHEVNIANSHVYPQGNTAMDAMSTILDLVEEMVNEGAEETE
jgi:hypothetical protein